MDQSTSWIRLDAENDTLYISLIYTQHIEIRMFDCIAGTDYMLSQLTRFQYYIYWFWLFRFCSNG